MDLSAINNTHETLNPRTEITLNVTSQCYTYLAPPFKNFMQSPVGLVPKANGKTRLIFHLSYNFNDKELSLNDCTPEELASVKYKDIDFAVKASMRLTRKTKSKRIFYSKTDLTSAFRILPLLKSQYCWLLLKVKHPVTNVTYYFVEKNLPFGASSSCKLFQEFSESLRHIIESITDSKYQVVCYLDDYLFLETSEQRCNRLVNAFIDMSKVINCPLAMEKTEFGTTKIVFLGILLDGEHFVLSIPKDKKDKALEMLCNTVQKRKIKVKNIQRLTGTLNFLGRGLIPGRAFTRRMYAKLTVLKCGVRKMLRDHHHVTLDADFLRDCHMWITFLNNSEKLILCRPYLDILGISTAKRLKFYTDALGSLTKGGFGAFFDGRWFSGVWDRNFMSKCRPSIEFLELYALCLGLFTWAEELKNCRIVLHCDNSSVRDMLNATSSKCEYCMQLIRLFVLNNLTFNRKVYIEHISTKKNFLADSLSRQKLVGVLVKSTCKYEIIS